MSQPVKLSDSLVMDARTEGAAMQRSIAGQVEFWARLGRSMERMMTGKQIGDFQHRPSAASLAARLETIPQPIGRERLHAYLASKPFPRFTADPKRPRVFIREDEDGTRTAGRFQGRIFEVLAEQPMEVAG